MPVDDKGREKGPAADLLRRALASSAAAAEPCPDPEILAAYADRALDASETAHYELHFSQCAHCREQLAAMSRAAAPAANARAPRLSWIWTWGWIALAPVTAVLLIAAIFFARRPAATRVAEEPQSLVAMQTPSQPPSADLTPGPAATPAEPAAELRKAPPAKAMIPPGASRMHSETDSIQRAAPPKLTADVNSDAYRAKVSPTVEEKELTSGAAIQLDKSAKQAAPASPKTEVGGQSAGGFGVRSQTQTVTVEAAAAPAPSSTPAPAQLANGVDAGAVSGGNAGVPSAAAPVKKARAFGENAANGLSVNETVTVEAAANRDVRTIVRSPDPRTLWRISSGRFVERSTDAGASWRAQWTSVNARVVAGSAPSVETCWLVGRDGVVLLTTDGKNWRTVEPPAKEDFVDVAASGASSATITATNGRKFETRDGGKHWLPAP